MKKIFIYLTMAAVIAGCQKPEAESTMETDVEFTASVENFDSQTKTSMDADRQVIWSLGDHLAIFRGSKLASKYKVADESAGQGSAKFTMVQAGGDDFYAGTEIACNVAFYPYFEELALSGASLESQGNVYNISGVTLPQVQTYAENSFANGAFLMAAVTESQEDHNLNFKNVLGAMKLQFKGSCIVKSIKVEGADGEKLSGAATVLAYADNLTPAIKMASDAFTSVTLDCGEGVQLSASEVTNFYIALPPVLFEKGFIVTITDVDDKEYIVSASAANAVQRSVILAMPVVVVNSELSGNPEEDDEPIIPVFSVIVNRSSLKLYEGEQEEFVAYVQPTDATNQTVVWSSSDQSVASIDQNGLLIAKSAGTVKISALAGGKIGTCTVTVGEKAVASVDYVDEYGINHGMGIAVGGSVWAPVNCGYHSSDYQWGKLYQWGRRYGQGYSGYLYDNGNNEIELVSDASLPEFADGGVSLQGGNHSSNANVFYIVGFSRDWLFENNDQLWNRGTENDPVKTDYDPCPSGWRVPTQTELTELSRYFECGEYDGQYGCWFTRTSLASSNRSRVFLPTAGYRASEGEAYGRGFYGGYSSSSCSYVGWNYVHYLLIEGDYVCMECVTDGYRAIGRSIRCVQE